MPKETRSNLAIFTLAGSILISSVLVSMNQSNAHSTSATKKEFLALKQCINNFSSFSEELVEYLDSYEVQNSYKPGVVQDIPSKFEPYIFLVEGTMPSFGIDKGDVYDPNPILTLIADRLRC
jgi:hypothetical protein